jgi:chromate transporter
MVAYIGTMAVKRKKWLDDESFNDGVALCQTVPGATAMQTAAYVGLRTRGLPGAALSFIGFGLPAFVFMMILSALYVHTHDSLAIISVFAGLQVIIVAIVANATISFGKKSLKTWKGLAIAAVAAGMFGLEVNPILVILLAAFSGFLLFKNQILQKRNIGTIWKPYSSRNLVLVLAFVAAGFVVLFMTNAGLFNLAALMARIDLFAFGGGFASVPIMFHEIVNVSSWLDSPTLLNGIALGQITPGPIVITATFIGYMLHGLIGGIIATISVFMPSFLIVVGVAPYYDRLLRSIYFDRAVKGILCSFVGLLLSVTIRFALTVPWNLPRIGLASVVFVAFRFKINILWVVLIGIAVSILIF